MTSIFTYESEPLNVVSPWPRPTLRQRQLTETVVRDEICGFKLPVLESIEAYEVSKLDAEPQEGPIEYKLHLLLRPRRTFTSTSTTVNVSGSHLSKFRNSDGTGHHRPVSGASTPSTTPNSQSRQNRLQHLTTQLLWRLQQSSPNHASTKSNLILPILPGSDLSLYNTKGPGPLVAGLEESKGALYEIGVSDNGVFVGLTLDELEESVLVLSAMANSIGCRLKIIKMVIVGDCKWQDDAPGPEKTGSLWVSEVFVGPTLETEIRGDIGTKDEIGSHRNSSALTDRPSDYTPMRQMRVSLTGTTTSGKSSLLGTLSTSTLDNGRGKSRLSLLRHRHEIVSGVTSSLAQELIGYQDLRQSGDSTSTATHIINYASPNTSSWTDIHNSSVPGRLVFLTDSAGHPKFRRTTVRGLISWAPHWTFCCVAADDEDNTTGKLGATATSADVLGSTSIGVDLSKGHLELCLNLDLPLVCIVTKLDLASRNGLRQTVSKILSTIKRAGRKPVLLASTSPSHGLLEDQQIPYRDTEVASNVLKAIPASDLSSVVPIVLTSALTGLGIGQVHSLLHQLPIQDANEGPQASRQPDSLPSALFHIDEIFAVGDQGAIEIGNVDEARPRYILSGYLRYGLLQIGSEVDLGPFAQEDRPQFLGAMPSQRSRSFPGLSKSLPKDFTTHSPSAFSARAASPSLPTGTSAQSWHKVRITSLRHLRLPVRHLSGGQVGTIAISTTKPLYTNAEPCLRRGMVICSPSSSSSSSLSPMQGSLQSPPPAYRSISAVFADPNIYVNPGSTVTLYTASIRATAKIAEVRAPDGSNSPTITASAGDTSSSATAGKLHALASHEADSELFAFDDNSAATTSTAGGTPSASAAATGSGDSLALNEVQQAMDDVAADMEMYESVPAITEILITFRFVNSVEWVEMGTKLLVTPASGISMLTVPDADSTGEAPTINSAVAAGLDGFVGRIVHGET